MMFFSYHADKTGIMGKVNAKFIYMMRLYPVLLNEFDEIITWNNGAMYR